MDVLVSVDLEGVAGIATRQQIGPGGRDYPAARELMTAEANAAVAGAFEGGATSVVVNDSHGPSDNLLGERLDRRVEYVVGEPTPLGMVQELPTGRGVVLFVGYHAAAADPAGVLAHTFSGGGFTEVRLGGAPIGEAELNALIAAEHGVPVGLVTGDDVICAHAERTFPGVVTVAVKTALGRTAARSRHPAVAREAITAGAARAVRNAAAGLLSPLSIPDELLIEAELRPNGAADLAARVPGTERVGGRTVRFTAAGPRQALDVLEVWAALAAHYPHR
ncbi:M55 family metallopeptidase [Amycolatopsis sp. PS_44_ISF1]|uniref:M55 family metallopeptidase n=1 Tax=Amycolatopsis sp. PS_44_ISF1 TaxID=2974917 RepID=UPI0028DF9FAC|nr:M55 family metallopeptidase [Amycolatopsis sp. PS_44_ISF1]MDT8913351.1 M55 family metallopeptidase [Amycolatopsis sp. PS_44_ISF1]